MILVVDDNEDLRDMIRLFLQDRGYDTAAASNGREALEWLASQSPDVIVLDLTMPVMDGYQLLAARENDPALMQIPVVVMSAVENCAHLLRKYRITGCVSKPPSTDLLLQAIEGALVAGQGGGQGLADRHPPGH